MAGKNAGRDNSGRERDTSTSGGITSARASSASGFGSGPANGASGDTTDTNSGSEIHSGIGADDSGNSTDTSSGSDTGTGTGSDTGIRRGRGRPRGSGTGNRSANASEKTESIAEDLARVEPAPKRIKGVVVEELESLPESAKELIGDVYSIMFWLAAQATATPEVALEDSDAEMLGEKTEKFVKSLGKRRATNVMKLFGKFGPALGLMSGLAMVTVPRVKFVMRKTNRGPIQSAERPAAGTTTTNGTEASNTAHTGNSRAADAGIRTRSFTSSDFEEIGIRPDQSDT